MFSAERKSKIKSQYQPNKVKKEVHDFSPETMCLSIRPFLGEVGQGEYYFIKKEFAKQDQIALNEKMQSSKSFLQKNMTMSYSSWMEKSNY